jgi:ATP-dependent Clp protease ATP-binding subunit ClpB
LQVLDDGRLTDNKGRVVNFKNTIIIMTSNIGSHIIQERFDQAENGDENINWDFTRDEVFEELKKSVRPEFLNRVDETIMFTPLTKDQITEIVKLQMQRLNVRIQDTGIHLVCTEEALEHLSDKGYDPQFGARPVKRAIQRDVLNGLSKAILSGTIDQSADVVVDAFDGEIVFRKKIEEEKFIELIN